MKTTGDIVQSMSAARELQALSKANGKKGMIVKPESIEDFLKSFHGRMMKVGPIVSIVCYIGLGIGLAVMVASRDDQQLVMGGIVMAPFLLPLIGNSVTSLRFRSIDNWPPYRLVTRRREDVVWVYFISTKISVSGVPVGKSHQIALCGCDGKRITVGLHKTDMEALLPSLPSSFPHATLGWTEERETTFKKNPGGLRRAMKAFTQPRYSLV
jgi:hypothetical protein